MKSIKKSLFLSAVVGVAIHLAATAPASAISADLAKKCRAMAFKAYPPQRAGKKGGNSHEASQYYRACLANGGSPPPETPDKPAASQPK